MAGKLHVPNTSISSNMTVSRTLRQAGNEWYFRGIVGGSSPSVIKGRLSEALKYYYKAKSSAVNNDELSSTMKNIGKASFRMANVKSRELSRSIRFTEKETIQLENNVKFYAKEAMSNLSRHYTSVDFVNRKYGCTH